MVRPHHSCFARRISVLATAVLWICTLPCEAILFYDTGDANHNISAPTGSYENSGWQYEVQYGSFLGTIIGSQYIITAQHIGLQSSTIVHNGIFNGGSDVVYNIDASFNGGAGYWDVAGTDLRILKVQELFPYYAPIYTGVLQPGLTLVTHGMGGPRGDEVLVGGDLQGWKHGVYDGTARWGSNTVDSLYASALGILIKSSFSANGTTEEASLSVGDSGGGVFVNDNGIWKLAGVNYSVDGLFDTNTIVGDGSEFDAALFERDGLYQGSDAFGWSAAPPGPSSMYASSVTSSAATIMTIALVPEPHSAFLVMLALTGGFLQRRRVTPQA
ncbi:MAG: trypsin-like serine protease [Prosthecobacter sp.]